MKKLLFIFITIFIVFLIYLCNVSTDIYYVSINNFKDTDEYIIDYLKENDIYKYDISISEDDLRIKDIIDGINDNEIIKDKTTFKHALIKSDILVLNFNNTNINDIINSTKYTNKEKYTYIDEYVLELSSLINIIREYCKEDIYFYNFYNNTNNYSNNKYIDYINNSVKRILNYNRINIINLDQEKINKLSEINLSKYFANKLIDLIK